MRKKMNYLIVLLTIVFMVGCINIEDTSIVQQVFVRNTVISLAVLLTENHFSLIYPKCREIPSLKTILGV